MRHDMIFWRHLCNYVISFFVKKTCNLCTIIYPTIKYTEKGKEIGSRDNIFGKLYILKVCIMWSAPLLKSQWNLELNCCCTPSFYKFSSDVILQFHFLISISPQFRSICSIHSVAQKYDYMSFHIFLVWSMTRYQDFTQCHSYIKCHVTTVHQNEEIKYPIKIHWIFHDYLNKNHFHLVHP